MICQYCPIAHRLIGDPSRSSYFDQCAMLVRFCPSPEPVTNWGAYPDVLNRTLRGHSIVSRSQGDPLLSAVPSQTELNLYKCLVQDLLLHPIRNPSRNGYQLAKEFLSLKTKINYFFVLDFFSLLTTGGLISVGWFCPFFVSRQS
jgi:hypothetical protein